ncbi:hypothetical protein BATDEDRAFT_92685 [Batrachochytrium dendrobatidis JAM81]|uniref:Uncharacterized protein n=2 Tax=Batrachochytrium dendrobatidis TaxID=109871 RepID=F4PDX8_BATDJ|nr:uncharacterized protein BATDEDRAFT_92685 [Batrachochytrium dendrobatidis JAM81]EGF76530.1 hypothetical protein BATDEDRAFT_92685 [Batrachochytrium dendrobatidis JAM81]KAK5672264.1 hypothetical protein QVD99_001368 [Batrachochytrium dendrobatidis]OAJ39303.1 hypothetical protein BDEG_23164 [Batrachochytrium dendrobatidis JEL423]|eukprot:XP_006682902.1 hypothetical protein BATDEDRAFT_92685 [Batrachochytrium dendrobatidis JAM81]
MKFIDILFVLSAAATANAILVSDNGNGSVQASSTSSQVSSPTNEPGPSAPKRGRKQSMNQPGPSTSSQDQQQPVSQGESSNTVPNQVTGLSKKKQKVLNRMKKRLELLEKMERSMTQNYYDYVSIGLKKQRRLRQGKDVTTFKHSLEVEKQFKTRTEELGDEVDKIKEKLKKFMTKHGLEFQESNLD